MKLRTKIRIWARQGQQVETVKEKKKKATVDLKPRYKRASADTARIRKRTDGKVRLVKKR